MAGRDLCARNVGKTSAVNQTLGNTWRFTLASRNFSVIYVTNSFSEKHIL